MFQFFGQAGTSAAVAVLFTHHYTFQA